VIAHARTEKRIKELER
jgi:hypothetical protein